MGEQQRGRDKRLVILADLARAYDDFESPPLIPVLAARLGMKAPNLRQQQARRTGVMAAGPGGMREVG